VGASGSKSLESVGFLTVVQDRRQGWLGGYLVLNTASRPLEFHCTAPVKPNRAQQILYGPTLAPYLCGEQIGPALAGKSNVQPLAVFTDVAAMMSLRTFVDWPLALVEFDDSETKPNSDDAGQESGALMHRLDGAHGRPTPHDARRLRFRAGERALAVDEAFAGDQQKIAALLDRASALDLCEPFERIREAIEETQLRKP